MGNKKSIGVISIGILFVILGFISTFNLFYRHSLHFKNLPYKISFIITLILIPLILGMNLLRFKEWARKGAIFYFYIYTFIYFYSAILVGVVMTKKSVLGVQKLEMAITIILFIILALLIPIFLKSPEIKEKFSIGTDKKREGIKIPWSKCITIFGIFFLIFALFDLFSAWQKTHFSPFLVARSTCLLYLSFYILQFKEWARKGIIFYHIFIILCLAVDFILICHHIKKFGTYTITPLKVMNIEIGFTIYSLIIFYFFTRPQVKEHFK